MKYSGAACRCFPHFSVLTGLEGQSRADDRLRTFVTCVKSINILTGTFQGHLAIFSFAHCISRSSKYPHSFTQFSTQMISLHDAYISSTMNTRSTCFDGIPSGHFWCFVHVALAWQGCFVHVQHVWCMFDPQNFQRLCSICSVRDVRDVRDARRVDGFGVCRGLRGVFRALWGLGQVEWSSHRRIWCHVQNVYSYISMYIIYIYIFIVTYI